MSHELAQDLPLWAAIVIAFFLLVGSFLTLLGSIGLVRFKNFYDRLHMPTLGTSWGGGGIIIASMLFFTLTSGRLVVHEFLITIFMFITTPVTLMMLSRAAIYRESSNDWRNVSLELFDLYREPKQKENDNTIPENKKKTKEKPKFIEYHSS